MNAYPRPDFHHTARLIRQRIWQRCRPRLALLAAIIMAFLFCRFGLAVEVPDRIVAALCQIESGCEWRGIGDIKGRWSVGADGEVSPFQLTQGAIADMGAAAHSARIHRDPVYAESLARLWLSRCYAKAGNWPAALAIYNGGRNYRSLAARDYSKRVLALASVL